MEWRERTPSLGALSPSLSNAAAGFQRPAQEDLHRKMSKLPRSGNKSAQNFRSRAALSPKIILRCSLVILI